MKRVIPTLLAGTAILCVGLAFGTTASKKAHAVSPDTAIEKGTVKPGIMVPVAADAGDGGQKFIEGMAQRAVDFLANTTMSQDQKAVEFRNLLQDSFDLETIGRFALGRYWNTATPEQRKEYQRLFRDMVVKVYSNRFKEYQGQKVETRSHRNDANGDVIVTSFIVPETGAEIQVDWRTRNKNGKWKIVDVIVEGVSMSVTQRSDFSSVIQRGGGDMKVLLDYLRK
ncbi:MAG TPA: ABC transporter substrate-binding protein [Alphaproteobacteria bacterium]